jgi:hypothetical protein
MAVSMHSIDIIIIAVIIVTFNVAVAVQHYHPEMPTLFLCPTGDAALRARMAPPPPVSASVGPVPQHHFSEHASAALQAAQVSATSDRHGIAGMEFKKDAGTGG